jgi:hypothetical protein
VLQKAVGDGGCLPHKRFGTGDTQAIHTPNNYSRVLTAPGNSLQKCGNIPAAGKVVWFRFGHWKHPGTRKYSGRQLALRSAMSIA